MRDCVRLIATKELIKEILKIHKGKSYFQCGKCSSIKSDAKELARTLHIIAQASIGSEDEALEEIGEQCSDLLNQIIVIGMPDECHSNSSFYNKWRNENDERHLPEINDFEDEVFIESDNVVLAVDDACGCMRL